LSQAQKFDLNQGTINYTRYFGFVRRLMWVKGSVPLASLAGSVTGSKISGSVTGTGDSSCEVAMLLKGGRRSAGRNSKTTSLPPLWR
jgi:hypothetical protein